MRKILSFFLLLSLLFSCALAEGKYPTKWDLTIYFASEAEWQEAYDRAAELIPSLGAFRGKLSSAQNLVSYIEATTDSELSRTMNALNQYVSLRLALNPADLEANQMVAQLSILDDLLTETTAFADAELYALPLAKREAMLADPLMAPYRYAYRELDNPDIVPFDEETDILLSTLESTMGGAFDTYQTLLYVDLPYPEITMPDGSVQLLDEPAYADLLNNPELDRDFKIHTTEISNSRVLPFANTFASLMNDFYNQSVSDAWVNGYDTVRDLQLAMDDIQPEVYDLLIESAHKGIPTYQRYLNTHKQALHLDTQYGFDLATPVSAQSDPKMDYDDAVDLVREALSILGEDYIAAYDEIVNSQHIDVYPASMKETGSFSTSGEDGRLPFELLNYMGYTDDVSTLAHEIGHSIYTLFSDRTQLPANRNITIFTHEVTSTTNELLFYEYMKQNSKTDDERLFYLEKELNMYAETFFMQTLYAEFEDYCYQLVEQGYALDAQTLADEFLDLFDLYCGDTIQSMSNSSANWLTIPHFYYSYYVYQYATAVSYASVNARNILSGKEGALDAYLNFLHLGCSASPSDLLSGIGIDILDKATYDDALAFFSSLVDEYEALIGKTLVIP